MVQYYPWISPSAMGFLNLSIMDNEVLLQRQMCLVCIIKYMSIKVKIEFITVQFYVIANESFVRQTGFFVEKIM